MSAKTLVIATLDKRWPPKHSFVDGMLSDVLARESDIQMRLCISCGVEKPTKIKRYNKTVCLPMLYPRRGLWRFVNLLKGYFLLRYQINRACKRGQRVVLFVRNDPVLLCAASLLRKRVDRLVFQSSFPHEQQADSAIKRTLATKMYQFASRNVDAVTGVSPVGVARIRRLFSNVELGLYIPLLADFPIYKEEKSHTWDVDVGPLFIYIGTHAPERRQEIVLHAIVNAIDSEINARFLFVGGRQQDITRLQQVDGVDALTKSGIVEFRGPVQRDEIPKILASADIGISLVPPTKINKEMSPTKLAEYMGAGLAVLASYGVPLQEHFVKESNGGVLVDWNVNSISKGITRLCSSENDVKQYALNTRGCCRFTIGY